MTLTGLVLPIGGVKEKALAARRSGILRVILPEENAKDLRDLPEEVRREMQFILAARIEEVWAAAIPTLAERLGPAARPRVIESGSEGGNGRQEIPRAAQGSTETDAR